MVNRNIFLLRSISSVSKCLSSELICWLTADCVIWLIRAALVKLRLSARSQKTRKLSICISPVKLKTRLSQTLLMHPMYAGLTTGRLSQFNQLSGMMSG